MKRERQLSGAAQGGRLQKSSYASTARGIGLQHIDRTSGKHALKIERVVAILSRRDLHPRWGAIANEPQTFQIIGRNWLFKPTNIELRELLRLGQSLFAGVSPVGVHKQFHIRADGFSRRADSIEGQPSDRAQSSS